MKKSFSCLLVFLIIFAIAGCEKAEEKPSAESLMQGLEQMQEQYGYLKVKESLSLGMEMSIQGETVSLGLTMDLDTEIAGRDAHGTARMVHNENGVQEESVKEVYSLYRPDENRFLVLWEQDGSFGSCSLEDPTHFEDALFRPAEGKNLELLEEVMEIDGMNCYAVCAELPLASFFPIEMMMEAGQLDFAQVLKEDRYIPVCFYFSVDQGEFVMLQAEGRETFESLVKTAAVQQYSFPLDLKVTDFSVKMRVLEKNLTGAITVPEAFSAAAEHDSDRIRGSAFDSPKLTKAEGLAINGEDLECRSFLLDEGAYTSDIYLIRNRSEETLDVHLSARAYDENGQILEQDDTWIIAVGPGKCAAARLYFDGGGLERVEHELAVKQDDAYMDISDLLSYEVKNRSDTLLFEVSNQSGEELCSLQAYILFLDEDGNMLDFDYDTFPSYGFTIQRREIAKCEFVCRNAADYASYEIYLMGHCAVKDP